jgi:isopentenyl-diphosphate delta-isomerase type 1
LFDVVDEDDCVVGTARRSVVHRDQLPHRAVHVFVFDSGGRLFLQKRSLRKDSAPGLWASSCSGHVDSGEDYVGAAARELAEELGLAGPVRLEPLFKERARPETGFEFTRVYRCQSDGPFVLEEGEIDDGRWVGPAELAGWLERSPEDFAASFRHLWGIYTGRR